MRLVMITPVLSPVNNGFNDLCRMQNGCACCVLPYKFY
jgi:hypothetical protein